MSAVGRVQSKAGAASYLITPCADDTAQHEEAALSLWTHQCGEVCWNVSKLIDRLIEHSFSFFSLSLFAMLFTGYTCRVTLIFVACR